MRLTYLQLSRDTFVELLPTAAGTPTGITHVGIETADVAGSIANPRKAGFKIDDASPNAVVPLIRLTRAIEVASARVDMVSSRLRFLVAVSASEECVSWVDPPGERDANNSGAAT